MLSQAMALRIELWPIDRFVFYARNPRKNDAAVDRMGASIREFGLKIPVLARSDGTIVDGHLRIKVGIMARRRHHQNPRDPLRRVDRCTGEGLPADGEPFGNVGGLGRRVARP